MFLFFMPSSLMGTLTYRDRKILAQNLRAHSLSFSVSSGDPLALPLDVSLAPAKPAPISAPPSLLLFDPAGGLLPPRPRISGAVARRGGQGRAQRAGGLSLYEGPRSQALSGPRAPISSLIAISLVRPRRRLSLAPTAGFRGRRAQGVSRLAALQRPPSGSALTRPSTTARWFGRGLGAMCRS